MASGELWPILELYTEIDFKGLLDLLNLMVSLYQKCCSLSHHTNVADDLQLLSLVQRLRYVHYSQNYIH